MAIDSSDRALILAERDDLIADLHRMVGNQLAIRAGYMRLDENPLLGSQIDACRRHIDRLEGLLGNQNADHGSTLGGSRTVVGKEAA